MAEKVGSVGRIFFSLTVVLNYANKQYIHTFFSLLPSIFILLLNFGSNKSP